MNISINTTTGKPARNFWNNVHFHPTDAAEDSWGRAILDQVARDHAAQYVRLYTMFEDVVTRDASGNLVFDFSASDRRLDYMVDQGFRLLLCFNFMPLCMAAAPNQLSGKRYKNKHFCRSAPRDYNEWRHVCKTQAEHLIKRYSLDKVAEWYFHCWNEPDLAFWMTPDHFRDREASGDLSKLNEYCKLYDYFEAGLADASPRLRVGGPSCGHAKSFFDGFLKHAAGGQNHVTGQTGTRIDFVSMHCYSSIPQDMDDPLRHVVSPASVVAQYNTYRAIMERHKLGAREVIIDEWGAAAEGYLGIDRNPDMRFRETEYFAAFYARLIDLFLRNGKYRPPERMMLCLSGQGLDRKDFDGRRTLFTAHGYRKPIYNAFVLAARLGEQQLDFQSDSPLPAHIGIVATKTDRGNVKILLYNAQDGFSGHVDSVNLKLDITGISGRYRLRHYRIDRMHSNAYGKWCAIGCPEFPSTWERNEIADAGNLALLTPETETDLTGLFHEETVLSENSVALIELDRQA